MGSAQPCVTVSANSALCTKPRHQLLVRTKPLAVSMTNFKPQACLITLITDHDISVIKDPHAAQRYAALRELQ